MNNMAAGGALRQPRYEEREAAQRRPEPNEKKKLRSRVLITNMDYAIYLVVGILTFVGIVMVFSASYLTTATDPKFNNDPFYFLKNTAIWAVLGFIAMNVMTVIPYKLIKVFAYPFYGVTIILLALVVVIGISTNGATRWIPLPIPGIEQFQPSELAKAATIFLIARIISDRPDFLHKWKRFLICSALVVLITGFVGYGGMSSAIITAVIGFGMIFIASPHVVRFILAGIGAVVGLVGYLWYLSQNIGSSVSGEFRGERFLAWLDPFAYPQDTGFQTIQALYAIASGGLFGLGIGQSRQTSFLPEAHNDMVFAIICEELGLVGAAIILLLFGIFIWRGIRVAVNAPDTFGSMTAAGIVLTIASQTIINVAVVTNSIPNTGVTMPFVSYGGTSLLVCMTLAGVLLNISRHTRE